MGSVSGHTGQPHGRPRSGVAGMSPAQLVVLALLDAAIEPMTPARIAAVSQVGVASVRSALSHLARRRMAVRVGRRGRGGQPWAITQKGMGAVAAWRRSARARR